MIEIIQAIFTLTIIYFGYALAYIAGKNDVLNVIADKIVKFCETLTKATNNRESDIVVEDVPVEGEKPFILRVDISTKKAGPSDENKG
jgi:hypothetical protein